MNKVCYKGIKFINGVGTAWTAVRHIEGDEWEFISHKNHLYKYDYLTFYERSMYSLNDWKVIHNFKGYLKLL